MMKFFYKALKKILPKFVRRFIRFALFKMGIDFEEAKEKLLGLPGEKKPSSLKKIESGFWVQLFEKIIFMLDQFHDLLLRFKGRQNPAKKTFYMINPKLRNVEGQYFEKTEEAIEGVQQQHYRCLVFSDQRWFLLPKTSQSSSPETIKKTPPAGSLRRLRRKVKILIKNLGSYFKLKSILNKKAVQPNWIISCDMISAHEIFAWAWWLKSLDRKKVPQISFTYQYTSDWIDDWCGVEMAAYAFEWLNSSEGRPDFKVCTNSHQLAENCFSFASLKMEILSIPKATHPILPLKGTSNSLVVVSLGNFWNAKGFAKLLQNIASSNERRRLISFQSFSSSITSHSTLKEKINLAVDEIQNWKAEEVALINKAFRVSEYYRFIEESDRILFPFWMNLYFWGCKTIKKIFPGCFRRFIRNSLYGLGIDFMKLLWFSSELPARVAHNDEELFLSQMEAVFKKIKESLSGSEHKQQAVLITGTQEGFLLSRMGIDFEKVKRKILGLEDINSFSFSSQLPTGSTLSEEETVKSSDEYFYEPPFSSEEPRLEQSKEVPLEGPSVETSEPTQQNLFLTKDLKPDFWIKIFETLVYLSNKFNRLVSFFWPTGKPQEKIFCMINPSLKDMHGHYFEYTKSLVEEVQQRKYTFLALVNKRAQPEVTETIPCQKVLSREVWYASSLISKIPKIGYKLNVLIENFRYYRMLNSHLNGRKIQSDWIIFCDMLCHNQIFAWAWWLQSIPEKNRPQINLLFRYSSDWLKYWCGDKMATYAFQVMERNNLGNSIRISTDSHRLSQEYSYFTNLPVDVFPIPHTIHPIFKEEKSDSEEKTFQEAVSFVSLGGARDEKGFLEILQMIQILRERGELGGLRFCLQSTNLMSICGIKDEMISAMEEIENWGAENIHFISEVLNSGEYYQLIQQGDVVLLPYWRSIYVSRTSGIFTEALAAGKNVIVTENTWMSDQLEEHGAGVTCKDRDPESLAQAVLQIKTNFAEYREKAQKKKEPWLKKNNPLQLVEKILNPTSTSKVKRVALFYPWGDILERKSGAGQRVNSLIDLLVDNHCKLTVIVPELNGDFAVGKVNYLGYHRSSWRVTIFKFLRALVESWLYIRTLGRSKGQTFMLWQHLELNLDPGFACFARKIVGTSDIVIMEYTFWTSTLSRLCKKKKIKLIVTDYDIVAHQVTRSNWLRKKTLKAELKGMDLADHAVSVSIEDQQRFKQYGVESELIVSGFDTNSFKKNNPTSSDLDHLKQAIGEMPKHICLFVGSYYTPNLEAVEILRKVAIEIPEAEGISMVIVGGCCQPERSKNFCALGKVETEVLQALYHQADLVLIPLISGTGISIKTIEAMAYGKALLGTTTGFRGYPVKSEEHCVICDNFSNYSKIIEDLCKDPEKRGQIGKKAQTFSEAYDSRNLYKRYIELIEEFT